MMVKMSVKDSTDDIKKAFNLFRDTNHPKVFIGTILESHNVRLAEESDSGSRGGHDRPINSAATKRGIVAH